MINFDNYANENKTEHNSNWPYIPDHPYRILITGGSGSGKTNALLNLINNQPVIDKIYLYAKDPYEAKYQFLIHKRESTGVKHFNDSKAYIECSDHIKDIPTFWLISSHCQGLDVEWKVYILVQNYYQMEPN